MPLDLSIFDTGISGGSAGSNSARWYTCSLCGACIVDRDYSTVPADQNRKLHAAWHDLNDDPSPFLEELKPIPSSSLIVNAEFLDIIEKYGEEETWIVLGKLKDLLT